MNLKKRKKLERTKIKMMIPRTKMKIRMIMIRQRMIKKRR